MFAELVLHEPTGLVYAACSTPTTRQNWTPAILLYNTTELPNDNYIATFDPHTGKVTHLTLSGFDTSHGFYVHGMDVIPSVSDPNDLYVYIVNHRPFPGKNAHDVGADSVVEIFQTKSGSHVMTHLQTVENNAVLISPNDIIGSPDGKSFHFTNDRNVKTLSVSRFLPCSSTAPDFVCSISSKHLKYGAYQGKEASGTVMLITDAKSF